VITITVPAEMPVNLGFVYSVSMDPQQVTRLGYLNSIHYYLVGGIVVPTIFFYGPELEKDKKRELISPSPRQPAKQQALTNRPSLSICEGQLLKMWG
jgi:hypothetical protein